MLLTVAQAASRRRVSRVSVHNWLKAGLAHQWIGNQIVIDSADLERFQPRPAGNPTFKKARKPRARKAIVDLP